MKHLVLVLLFLTFGCSATPIQAVERDCTMALAQEAEGVAGRSFMLDWDGMYAAFLKYRVCDDGAIAGGFSDGVVRLLANKWELLPRLQELVIEDNEFRTFVFRHIDATTDPDDLTKILSNVQNCPQGYEHFCDQIRTETERAWRDL